MSAPESEPLNPAALRDDFPILGIRVPGDQPLVYLDNAATTQRPRQVIQAMTAACEQHYANVHRGAHWLSNETTDRYEDAREAVRRFVNARCKEEVVFTSGTTAGINLVARSWGDANIAAGDEILLTEMEHHSNMVPWQQLAQRRACRLRYLPITDDGLLRLDALDTLLGERTKLVSVAAVSNVLGTVNPLEEIVRRAHVMGARVLVDAAQFAPHLPLDVQQLGADFVAFSGHKMLGPSGVGVLWGRESLLDAMPPFLGGGSMVDRVTLDGFVPIGLPNKFEAGTPPIVPVLGLHAAIQYLVGVGLDRIHRHEQALTRCAHELLQSLDGLRLLGPSPERKGGIVSFVVAGVSPDDIAKLLDEQGIAVRQGHHCAMPLHHRLGLTASVRASFYLYNTVEEIAGLHDALRKALRILRR
jgi:cysteine desulfurase/selenocysteine lyase